MQPVVLAHIVERTDVCVVQARDRARLACEPLVAIAIRGEMRRQHFDGDDAIEPGIERLVDFAHPSRAEQRSNFVDAEPVAGVQRAADRGGGVALGGKHVEDVDRRFVGKAAGLPVCRQQ